MKNKNFFKFLVPFFAFTFVFVFGVNEASAKDYPQVAATTESDCPFSAPVSSGDQDGMTAGFSPATEDMPFRNSEAYSGVQYKVYCEYYSGNGHGSVYRVSKDNDINSDSYLSSGDYHTVYHREYSPSSPKPVPSASSGIGHSVGPEVADHEYVTPYEIHSKYTIAGVTYIETISMNENGYMEHIIYANNPVPITDEDSNGDGTIECDESGCKEVEPFCNETESTNEDCTCKSGYSKDGQGKCQRNKAMVTVNHVSKAYNTPKGKHPSETLSATTQHVVYSNTNYTFKAKDSITKGDRLYTPVGTTSYTYKSTPNPQDKTYTFQYDWKCKDSGKSKRLKMDETDYECRYDDNTVQVTYYPVDHNGSSIGEPIVDESQTLATGATKTYKPNFSVLPPTENGQPWELAETLPNGDPQPTSYKVTMPNPPQRQEIEFYVTYDGTDGTCPPGYVCTETGECVDDVVVQYVNVDTGEVILEEDPIYLKPGEHEIKGMPESELPSGYTYYGYDTNPPVQYIEIDDNPTGVYVQFDVKKGADGGEGSNDTMKWVFDIHKVTSSVTDTCGLESQNNPTSAPWQVTTAKACGNTENVNHQQTVEYYGDNMSFSSAKKLLLADNLMLDQGWYYVKGHTEAYDGTEANGTEFWVYNPTQTEYTASWDVYVHEHTPKIADGSLPAPSYVVAPWIKTSADGYSLTHTYSYHFNEAYISNLIDLLNQQPEDPLGDDKVSYYIVAVPISNTGEYNWNGEAYGFWYNSGMDDYSTTVSLTGGGVNYNGANVEDNGDKKSNTEMQQDIGDYRAWLATQ